MRSFRPPAALVGLLALVACGGPGSKDGRFVLSARSAEFAVTRNAPPPPAVTISMEVSGADAVYAGAAYRAGQVPAPWLDIAMTGQGKSLKVVLSLRTTDLPPGRHVAAFTVGTADTGGNVLEAQDVVVTCSVTSWSISPAAVVLGGPDGNSTAPVPLTVAFDDGGGAHPFAIAAETDSGIPWLTATPSAGSAGAAPITIELAGQRGSVTPGTHTGRVRLTVSVAGGERAFTVPVTFHVEATRIGVGAAGVGLTSSPTRSVLSREILVERTAGAGVAPWTATSDRPWLRVTPSGVAGQALSLVADPSGLAAGTHLATVAVASPDPTVVNAEQIRVGLTVLAVDPVAASVAHDGNFLAPSPVEPVVFVSGLGADVHGYDLNTGALVRTFAGVAGRASQLAVSGDGRRLYVHDPANTRVAELDATSGEILRTFDAGRVDASTPVGGGLAEARPGGHRVLVTPSTRIYDLETGAVLPNRLGRESPLGLTPSPDGGVVASSMGGAYRLGWTALAGGPLLVETLRSDIPPGAAEGQGCLSSDRTVLYTARGFPYDFRGYGLESGTVVRRLPGAAYPNAIVCVWNGLVVGGTRSYYDPVDVWVYGPAGDPLARLSSAEATYARNLANRGLAVSPDGTRLVSLAASLSAVWLRFQPLPPP